MELGVTMLPRTGVRKGSPDWPSVRGPRHGHVPPQPHQQLQRQPQPHNAPKLGRRRSREALGFVRAAFLVAPQVTTRNVPGIA